MVTNGESGGMTISVELDPGRRDDLLPLLDLRAILTKARDFIAFIAPVTPIKTDDELPGLIDAILADANCTMVCITMSMVLLASSLVYQLTGFGLIDSIGALGLAYFSLKEGKEAFEKASGLEDTCGCACAADD